MSKSLVVKTWVGGFAALVLGLMVVGFGVVMMLVFGGTWHATGDTSYQFVAAQDGAFWTGVAAVVAGSVIAAAGSLVQLIAWVGALINSYALADRTWFVVLLVGGLVGFFFALAGFAVMVAYLVAAPDGMPAGSRALTRTGPAALTPSGEWR